MARKAREEEPVRSAVRTLNQSGGTRHGTFQTGHTPEQLEHPPGSAPLGLGCSNPTALASPGPGEVVLYLGCGTGMDLIEAARQVDPGGRAIGVDTAEALLVAARENVREARVTNVELHRAEIDSLPVEAGSVDVVISDCVINLSPDRPRVLDEIFRALRPAGRVLIADIVLERALPAGLGDSVLAYVGCAAGASLRADYLGMIERAGFVDVRVISETHMSDALGLDDPVLGEAVDALELSPEQAHDVLDSVTGVSISATKPA